MIGRPLPNAVLLGGFVALTGRISMESLAKAIREKFGGSVAEKNVAGAKRAHEWIRAASEEPAHA